MRAHTRRIGASGQIEELAAHIITRLNQLDRAPADRAALAMLAEAQSRIAQFIAEHEARQGGG